MTPLYGRALCGKRVVDDASHGHWKTTTFIASLRCDGLRAPMVIDGAINGELFLAYVEQELVRTLKEGDIVLMDNLSSHKVAGVKVAIQCRSKPCFLQSDIVCYPFPFERNPQCRNTRNPNPNIVPSNDPKKSDRKAAVHVSIIDKSSKLSFGLHVQDVPGNRCPKIFPVGVPVVGI